MTDLDEALHRALRDGARTVEPPPWHLLQQRLRRRRAVRRAGAALATSAAVVVLASPVAAHLVRSDDTLTVATPPAPAPSPSGTATAPACSARQLRTSAQGGGVLSNGVTGATVVLQNTGPRACHLPERADQLLELAPTYAELPMTPEVSDQGGPQTVAAGGAVAFTIASVREHGSADCGDPLPAAQRSAVLLQFHLPGVGDLSVGAPDSGSYVLYCPPVVVSRLFPAEAPSAVSTTGIKAPPAVELSRTDEFGTLRLVARRPDGSSTISVDRVDLLSGAEAQAAARARHQDSAVDDFLVDDDPARRTYEVSPSVRVWGSIALSGHVEPTASDLDALYRFLATDQGGRPTLFHLEIDDGRVTGIEEQYRP